MINRFVKTTPGFARGQASQSAAWAVFARDVASGFVTTAHHALMLLGITAIAALALMFVKPELTDRLVALSPFGEAIADEVVAAPQVANLKANDVLPTAVNTAASALVEVEAPAAVVAHQQQRVVEWISRRYRVAADATNMLVSAAYSTAQELKLDPLLILSVMAIESRFNPFAESPVGAQGLMQVMSKVHHARFEDHGGVKAALDPVANIQVGSRILKEYVTRGGSVEAGLKLYVGAANFDTDFGYGAKVLAEYRRLKDVAMGKKVPIYSTSASAAKPRQPEPKTANAPAATSTATGDKVAALSTDSLIAE